MQDFRRNFDGAVETVQRAQVDFVVFDLIRRGKAFAANKRKTTIKRKVPALTVKSPAGARGFSASSRLR